MSNKSNSEVNNHVQEGVDQISEEQLMFFSNDQERELSLKKSYGEEKFDEVLGFDEDLLKAEWESYNFKVKLLEPIYKRRSEFIKKIPGFWLKAMTNDAQINSFIDPIDRDALAHLEDLTLEHDSNDARNVTFHFHFSKSNPYFSNRILTKKFTVVEVDPNQNNGSTTLKTNPKIPEMNKKYDLERPVESKPIQIDWTSKEHNLVSKKPWLNLDSLEDDQNNLVDQSFDGEMGSFFNFFNAENDKWGIQSGLLELHSKALDVYAGLIEGAADDDEDGISDDEEDDEEDDDPNVVVDLESEGADQPKKKKAKTTPA